ncbi:hypothetical protein BDV98DRAFT_110547 [Pterulicium gracile]|uniref:Uncharacterized protein n=1 Tax=Pterulicium gracile TaxID=1884261 RepID=A0A5C3QJ35_9AGAR|nr:hypothetical protein BDV98DRAFT_110547 [Pterula gracilis]
MTPFITITIPLPVLPPVISFFVVCILPYHSFVIISVRLEAGLPVIPFSTFALLVALGENDRWDSLDSFPRVFALGFHANTP